MFAPDYGINSSESIIIEGQTNRVNLIAKANGEIYDRGIDGSPNDWLEYISFN